MQDLDFISLIERKAIMNFYTPREIAIMLSVNYRKILDLIIAGELTGFRVGRQYRISHSNLMEYIQNNQVESANF